MHLLSPFSLNLPLYEHKKRPRNMLKSLNGVMNFILKLQAETDILILCWRTEIFDKQKKYIYLNEIQIPSSVCFL